jgi:hypothetical protein
MPLPSVKQRCGSRGKRIALGAGADRRISGDLCLLHSVRSAMPIP